MAGNSAIAAGGILQNALNAYRPPVITETEVLLATDRCKTCIEPSGSNSGKIDASAISHGRHLLS